MSTMVSAPVESKEMDEETKPLSTPIDDEMDNDKELNNALDNLRYLWLEQVAVLPMLMNSVIAFCLLLCSEVQLSAWQSNFGNSSDPVAKMQSNRMRISTFICSLMILATPISLILCDCGVGGLIKFCRRSNCQNNVKNCSVLLPLSMVFVLVICPWTKAQTLVTSLFQDDYVSPHKPNSIFILESMSVFFALQHLFFFFLLHRYKPPRFDSFKGDGEKIDEAATPPTVCEEIDKGMLSDEIPAQREAPVQP